MAEESASFISQLDETNPGGTDQRTTLDNHIRLTKKAVRQSYPNINSTVSCTPGALNFCAGLASNAQTQLNALVVLNVALSATLNTNIKSLSATLRTELTTTSDALRSQISQTSSNLDTKLETLSATLNAAKLGLSATAAASVLWGGSAKYLQTATPTLSDGDIWFEPN